MVEKLNEWTYQGYLCRIEREWEPDFDNCSYWYFVVTPAGETLMPDFGNQYDKQIVELWIDAGCPLIDGRLSKEQINSIIELGKKEQAAGEKQRWQDRGWEDWMLEAAAHQEARIKQNWPNVLRDRQITLQSLNLIAVLEGYAQAHLVTSDSSCKIAGPETREPYAVARWRLRCYSNSPNDMFFMIEVILYLHLTQYFVIRGLRDQPRLEVPLKYSASRQLDVSSTLKQLANQLNRYAPAFCSLAEVETRECPVCGESFEVSRQDHREFCSPCEDEAIELRREIELENRSHLDELREWQPGWDE